MSKSIQVSILDSLDTNKYLDDKTKIILQILISYNPRISEILNATWKNYFHDRFLILEGKKNSHSVIIRDREILKSISNLQRSSSSLIFEGITYSQIRSIISKNFSHLLNLIQHKKYRKLTHAFRYLNLKDVDNDEQIEVILHHRSLRSGIYYKNKLKGSTAHEKF